jgi:hypothetical protein
VSRQGSDYRIGVSMPADEDGFFGRQCPECGLIFRMDVQDYDALPDNLVLWCVYCGCHQEHSEFMTDQQRDRAIRAAEEFAAQLVQRSLDTTFGRLARSGPRGGPASFSYRSRPRYPRPLPGINELLRDGHRSGEGLPQRARPPSC